MKLTIIALNCTLTPSPQASSTDKILKDALGSKVYKDFKKTPKQTDGMTKLMVSNAVHLAKRLKNANYPGLK